VCHYLHCKTDGKYVQRILEHGVKNISITILNYRCWSTSFSDSLHNLFFFQKPEDPPTIHLTDEKIMSIPERICRFMMQKFISPEGAYQKHGHMSGFADLCDWTNEGQSKLCQVNDKFENILKS
jgi:hypothetical protein